MPRYYEHVPLQLTTPSMNKNRKQKLESLRCRESQQPDRAEHNWTRMVIIKIRKFSVKPAES